MTISSRTRRVTVIAATAFTLGLGAFAAAPAQAQTAASAPARTAAPAHTRAPAQLHAAVRDRHDRR